MTEAGALNSFGSLSVAEKDLVAKAKIGSSRKPPGGTKAEG